MNAVTDIVTSYWFWGAVGFIIGSVLTVRNMMKNGCSFPLAVISTTVAIYFGFLGSRVLYILLFQPRLFSDNFLLSIAFWQRTGTWLGSLLAFLGYLIILKIAGKPFWSNAGSAVPGMALAHGISRIGCLFAGCCYGSPTTVPWAIYIEKLKITAHPTPIYSMVGEFVSVIILQFLWRNPKNRKYLFPVYCMLLATHRFISEFFRGSDAGITIIPSLRVFQSICIIIFLVALCIIIIMVWKRYGVLIAILISFIFFGFLIISRVQSTNTQSRIRKESGKYLVITRYHFIPMLGKWKAMRTKQGFDVVIHGWKHTPTSVEVKKWIQTQTSDKHNPCKYILIVGDCSPSEELPKKWHMPSMQYETESGQNHKSFPTDSLFGDIDDDLCPDIAVGRITVQNKSQLSAQINKIIRYEKQKVPSAWFRVVLWGGFELYNQEIELMAKSMTKRLPLWLGKSVIISDPEKVETAELLKHPKRFIDAMNNPAFLSMVISHGSFRSVNPVKSKGKEIFLSVEDVELLSSGKCSGLLFLLACDAGKFNLSKEKGICLAEAFAESQSGPIITIAAMENSGPLTTYLICTAMVEEISKHHSGGELFLSIQRLLCKCHNEKLRLNNKNDPVAKRFLNEMNGFEESALPEILMYNMIGDPACSFNISNKFQSRAKPSF